MAQRICISKTPLFAMHPDSFPTTFLLHHDTDLLKADGVIELFLMFE